MILIQINKHVYSKYRSGENYVNYYHSSDIEALYIMTWHIVVPIIVVTTEVIVVTVVPVHSTSLGSGSHSPFPIHVDELDLLSICPVGQVNVIACPSRAGST